MNAMARGLLTAGVLILTVAAPSSGQEIIRPDAGTRQTRVGTRGADFLTIGVGARGQALGGANTALATGVAALYWNPAAIAYDEGMQAGISYAPLYADLDISHTFAGFVMPFRSGRVGLSVNTLSSGTMTVTTEDYPNGGDPRFGGTHSEYTWSSTAVGLHYALPVTDRLAVGATGKYITEGISGANASFLGLDIAATFDLGMFGSRMAATYTIGTESRVRGPRITQGIDQRVSGNTVLPAVRVINAELETRRTQLPSGFHFGVSSQLVGGPSAALATSPDHSVLLAVEGVEMDDAPFSPRLGVQYGFRDRYFVRVGKEWANDSELDEGFGHLASFGGGIRLPFGGRSAQFDYAYTNFGRLDNVQVFTLEVSF